MRLFVTVFELFTLNALKSGWNIYRVIESTCVYVAVDVFAAVRHGGWDGSCVWRVVSRPRRQFFVMYRPAELLMMYSQPTACSCVDVPWFTLLKRASPSLLLMIHFSAAELTVLLSVGTEYWRCLRCLSTSSKTASSVDLLLCLTLLIFCI